MLQERILGLPQKGGWIKTRCFVTFCGYEKKIHHFIWKISGNRPVNRGRLRLGVIILYRVLKRRIVLVYELDSFRWGRLTVATSCERSHPDKSRILCIWCQVKFGVKWNLVSSEIYITITSKPLLGCVVVPNLTLSGFNYSVNNHHV